MDDPSCGRCDLGPCGPFTRVIRPDALTLIPVTCLAALPGAANIVLYHEFSPVGLGFFGLSLPDF